jgi:chorismate synthase
MLNNYTHILANEVEQIICQAAQNKELTILSIMINGGSNGGEIKLLIDNFDMSFTIAVEDTIILDHKIALASGQSLKAISVGDGIKISVSVAELDA